MTITDMQSGKDVKITNFINYKLCVNLLTVGKPAIGPPTAQIFSKNQPHFESCNARL